MMPDDELTVMWRQAKDQREQVKILAELNGVSTAVMAEKLRGLGCELPELPAAWLRGVPPLKAKDPIFDLDRARALFAEGKSDLEIAEMLGISVYAFATWRRKNGMKRPKGGERWEMQKPPKSKVCKAQPPTPPEAEFPAPEPAPETAASGNHSPMAVQQKQDSAEELGRVLLDLAKRYPGLTLTVNGETVTSLCLIVRVPMNGEDAMSSTLDLEVG